MKKKFVKFSGAFDVMMLRMARDGFLSNLENLQCFQWEVCLETMLFIVDQCEFFKKKTKSIIVHTKFFTKSSKYFVLMKWYFFCTTGPKLRHIWGLDLLMLSPQSITAIQQHITNNNRYIGTKPDIKIYDHL